MNNIPLITSQNNDNNIINFKGKSYRIRVKSTSQNAVELDPQTKARLTDQVKKILNTSPDIQNRSDLKQTKITRRGIQFNNQSIDFAEKQHSLFDEIRTIAHQSLGKKELTPAPVTTATKKVSPKAPSSLYHRISRDYQIPTPSKLNQLKEGIKLIISGLGMKLKGYFVKSSHSLDPQKTDPLLERTHVSFKGQTIGKESVVRDNTIQSLIASKKSELKHLLSQPKLNTGLTKSLQEEIDRYERLYAGKTWVTSNQWRDGLKSYNKKVEHESLFSQLVGKIFPSRQRKLERVPLAPTETYIPAIVNSRMHTITTGNQSLSVHRSGALANLVDGSTSLPHLKEELVQKWASGQNYNDLISKPSAFVPLQIIKQFIGEIDRIAKYERLLKDQMVQYVTHQVQAHLNDLVDPSTNKIPFQTKCFQLTQVGLLNPKKQDEKGKIGKLTGHLHRYFHPRQISLHNNEQNQMLDMAEIFSLFDGTTVQFANVDAPYFMDRIVYLPQTMLKDIPNAANTPITLSCTYFNISVQGLKKNTGEQYKINENALLQLKQNLESIKKLLPHYNALLIRYEELKTRLQKGESNYDVAKEILLLQQEIQGGIGVNCFSGKDRTGYLMAQLVDHQLSHSIDQNGEIESQEKEALKMKLRTDLLDIDHGIASEIVHENTGHRVLKIQEWNVMGINKDAGPMADIIRIGHAALASAAAA